MKWMMFIKHLQTLGIAGAGKAIKSLGFEGVDLTVRPGGSVLPESVRKEIRARLAALLHGR